MAPGMVIFHGPGAWSFRKDGAVLHFAQLLA
jgi:hypothetical protein